MLSMGPPSFGKPLSLRMSDKLWVKTCSSAASYIATLNLFFYDSSQTRNPLPILAKESFSKASKQDCGHSSLSLRLFCLELFYRDSFCNNASLADILAPFNLQHSSKASICGFHHTVLHKPRPACILRQCRFCTRRSGILLHWLRTGVKYGTNCDRAFGQASAQARR